MQSQKAKNLFISIVLTSLVFLVLIHNFKQASFNCFNVIDLGIYQQALNEIASGNSLNPWITVRGVNIFADHFDPILLLAAPIVRIFNYSVNSVLFTEWFMFSFFLGLVILLYRKEYKFERILYFLAIAIFSKGILSGLEYPIHPTTWALIPTFLISYYLLKKNDLGVVLSALALCFFKESFPFAVFTLSFFFILNKKYKFFSILFVFSTALTIFNLKYRSEFMGQGLGYGSELLAGAFDSPFTFALNKIQNFSYLPFIKVFYPFLIPFAFYGMRELIISKPKDHPLLGTFLFAAPLFLIQFLGNKFHFQYGAQFIGILLPFVFYSTKYFDFSKKVMATVLILFIASSSSIYTKMFNRVFLNKNKVCSYNSDKIVSNQKINFYLRGIDKNDNILATGGIIPTILKPGLKVYQPVLFSPRQESYQYLLLEKEVNGVFPLSKSQIEGIDQRCTPFATEVILKNRAVSFYKGHFTEECLQQGSIKL